MSAAAYSRTESETDLETLPTPRTRVTNPMIGRRGTSRYYDEGYREGFALECRASRRVRETTGLTNVVVMIPFCRTLGEADLVLDVMAQEGLVRGRNGLLVYVTAEIPADIILAQGFAEQRPSDAPAFTELLLAAGVDSIAGPRQLRHGETARPTPLTTGRRFTFRVAMIRAASASVASGGRYRPGWI